MFHTYVTASSGATIDFDRAAFLMDGDLLAEARGKIARDMLPNGFNPFDMGCHERMGHTLAVRAQWVWMEYCRRHLEHYGEQFVPDADGTWDQSSP